MLRLARASGQLSFLPVLEVCYILGPLLSDQLTYCVLLEKVLDHGKDPIQQVLKSRLEVEGPIQNILQNEVAKLVDDKVVTAILGGKFLEEHL